MKKLLSYAVLALVSTFVFVGCNKANENATPTTPPTNGASTNATSPTNP